MLPITLTKTLAANSPNNIAASQSGTANTSLTLNGTAATGGVAILDTQRRVQINSAGNDSSITFAITGTREGNIVIGETLVGANTSNAISQLDYLTVTKVVPSAATAAAITMGTTGVGSTSWKLANYDITAFQLNIGVEVTGAVTYTVEYTFDDFVTVTPGGSSYQTPTSIPVAFPVTGLTATTSSTTGGFVNTPIRGWRLTVNSGTGTAVATGIQAGIRN